MAERGLLSLDDSVKKEGIYFLDVNIHTLRRYRLNGEFTMYTTVYLDKDDKIAFFTTLKKNN